MRIALLALLGTLAYAVPAVGQAAATAAAAAAAAAALPPATKLEAFKPAAGSVFTMSYTNVDAPRGIEVEAREVRRAAGTVVRGLLIQVRQSEYRVERAFVDVDEVPELVKGVDHVLSVKGNPSPGFKNFEVHYSTKGKLQVTAFNNDDGSIRYSIDAGRVVEATAIVDEDGMRKFREALVAAQAVLAASPASGK